MVWLLCMGWSVAHAAPVVAGWDDVPALVDVAWREGAGAGWQAREDGARAARRAVVVGPEQVRLEAQLGHPVGDQLLGVLEIPLTGGVGPRRAWEAEADLLAAAGDAARWQWTAQVYEAWADWWVADRFADHLTAWSAEVERELARLDAAAEAGVASALDVADLRAELGSVREEALGLVADAARARARVEGLLGVTVTLADDGDPEVLPLPKRSPWADLVSRAADHPEARAAQARVAADEAQRRALASQGVPTLTLGAMGLSDGTFDRRSYQPLGIVGVNVPLQSAARADRRALDGQIAGDKVDLAWTIQRLQGALRAESTAWDATRARAAALADEVVGPLEARQARLVEAFEAGLVGADRLVRAQRDLHHADHARLEVLAALHVSAARAAALERTLQGAP